MRRSAFTWWQSLLGLVFLGGLVVVFWPVSSRGGPTNGRRSACQTNLKLIGLAVRQYMQDNNDKYPLVRSGGKGWVDVLQPYVRRTENFQCPSLNSGRPATPQSKTDYFYNARLSGLREQRLNYISNIIMSGDGLGGSPKYSSLTQLPAGWVGNKKSPAYRHLEGANYGYADGHVKWLKPERVTNESAIAAASTFAPS